MKHNNYLRRLFLFAALCFSVSAHAETHTQNIPGIAADDGYAKCSAYGCAVGTMAGLAVGTGWDGWQNRALLSFDTSVLPDDAVITRAYLTVAYASGMGDPWQYGSNPLYVDVKTGTFGAASTEISDWWAGATANAVATVPPVSYGAVNSSDFAPAGIGAINLAGKTQLRLRFASSPYGTAYRFFQDGVNTVLHVEYEGSPEEPPARDYWPTTAWQYKTLAETGFNATRINNLNNAIQAGSFGSVYSLLISKNGYLVSERYFNGTNASWNRDLQSATKSIGSVLVGIAIDKGYLTLSDKIVDIFASYNIQNMDSRKQQMTVRHVLTQKHGAEWCEWNCPSEQNDSLLSYYEEPNNWIKYVLDKPMEAMPGTVFNYSTGHSALMGGMLKQKTPYTPEGFAQTFLFGPIGMTSATWFETDSTGMIHTGSILATTAQDLLRFGFLILNDGHWDGQQIVSKSYLDEAYTVDTVDPAGVGMHYGYQMWIVPVTVGGNTYNMRAASGTGGQWAFVVPELDLVVVTTGWEVSGNFSVTAAVDMMQQYIIPAALGL